MTRADGQGLGTSKNWNGAMFTVITCLIAVRVSSLHQDFIVSGISTSVIAYQAYLRHSLSSSSLSFHFIYRYRQRQRHCLLLLLFLFAGANQLEHATPILNLR